jgi:hypothetical protein
MPWLIEVKHLDARGARLALWTVHDGPTWMPGTEE